VYTLSQAVGVNDETAQSLLDMDLECDLTCGTLAEK